MLLQPEINMAVLQVLEQLHHAFMVVEGLLSGSSGCDFEQELAVVHILYNLTAIGGKLPASSAEETSDLRGWLRGLHIIILKATSVCSTMH